MLVMCTSFCSGQRIADIIACTFETTGYQSGCLLLCSLPSQGVVEGLSESNYAHYYGKFRTSAPKIKVRIRVYGQGMRYLVFLLAEIILWVASFQVIN